VFSVICWLAFLNELAGIGPPGSGAYSFSSG